MPVEQGGVNEPTAAIAATTIIGADVGGTYARLGWTTQRAGEPIRVNDFRRYACADHPSLAAILRDYTARLRDNPAIPPVNRAVVAIAGLLDGDRLLNTNLAWQVSLAQTRCEAGLAELELINDFVAVAQAIPHVEPEALHLLSGDADHRPHGPALVLGPGTGLGVGGLLVRDGRCYPLATEGGHASFAPTTPEQIRILEILTQQFGRVSNERLICGPGLVNLHRTLSEIAGLDPGQLQPPQVSERAAAGDPVAMRAIEVFMDIFGAVAGDAVLVQGAWDGVFLTGGLVPRLLGPLRHSGFRSHFENKGRFTATLSQVPSLAIVHPCPGLLGAAAYALDLEQAPTGASA